jgi:hypothetical protein
MNPTVRSPRSPCWKRPWANLRRRLEALREWESAVKTPNGCTCRHAATEKIHREKATRFEVE